MSGSNSFQGDLLRRIVSSNDLCQGVIVDEAVEEVELSLGLSLNGRFGVDPRASLKRSSSVSDFSTTTTTTTVRDEEVAATTTMKTCRVPPRPCMVSPLMRTCSLPTETEDEWRRRKELQGLRRMEAKRKRSEKQQRSSYSKLHRDRSRDNLEEAADRRVVEVINCPLPPPETQGSGGSSGVTESDGQAAQVVNTCNKARSESNIESLPKSEKEIPVTPQVKMNITVENPPGQLNGVVPMQNHRNKSTSPDKGTKEIVWNVLENMPSVSTKGDGPDGRRIEGFLYRYKKGEEVRIVCVCHGSFLTPGEFVKHAGGGDVLHPLKHIVVNPTPIL